MVQPCVLRSLPTSTERVFLHHPFNILLRCNREGQFGGKKKSLNEEPVWDALLPLDEVLLRKALKLQPPQDSRSPFNSEETKEQFREAGLVHCTSTECSRAMCLAARRPQVSFNCVSNWLLPMQLLPVSHSIFHRCRKGPGGTFCSEGQHSYRHIWVPNVEREEAHVKLKSGAGHQWRPLLINCCLAALWGRDSGTIRDDCWGLRLGGSTTPVSFHSSEGESC